jgi:curved DNA-binding protein CbpA
MIKRYDPFKILGVEPGKYTDSSLKATYLELIKKVHPEKNPEKFEQIRTAYNALKNARSPYDTLSIAPLKITNSTRTKEELLRSLEVKLGIEKKKTEYKRNMLLKQLEDITNDIGN